MISILLRRLPCMDSNGRYGFPCVKGLCPFGYDPFEDCFPYMTAEQKVLFLEMRELRSLLCRNSGSSGRSDRRASNVQRV